MPTVPRDGTISGLVAVMLVVMSLLAAGAAWATLPAVHGHIRYESFGYPDDKRSGSDWENFFEGMVRSEGELTPKVSYTFEARLVGDDVQFTAGGFSLRNEEVRRPYFSLTTAALRYRPTDGLRVAVGKQMMNWSVMDALQPANLMTAIDESDPFRRVEQGLYSLSVRTQRGGTYAELAVVPVMFTAARLPQRRWNIVPGERAGRQKDMPAIAFEETQAGIRLGTEQWGADVSLMGYVGRDWQPVFLPELYFVGGQERFKLVVFDTFPRLRAGGINVSRSFGEAILGRAETIYFSSPDAFAQNLAQTALGGEYTRGDWRLNLEYLRVDRVTKASTEPTDPGEREFFHSFLLTSLTYDAGGPLESELSVGYDFEEKFILAQVNLRYLVWQNLEVGVSGVVIQSQGDDYFARIRHEDRVGTQITYYFFLVAVPVPPHGRRRCLAARVDGSLRERGAA